MAACPTKSKLQFFEGPSLPGLVESLIFLEICIVTDEEVLVDYLAVLYGEIERTLDGSLLVSANEIDEEKTTEKYAAQEALSLAESLVYSTLGELDETTGPWTVVLEPKRSGPVELDNRAVALRLQRPEVKKLNLAECVWKIGGGKPLLQHLHRFIQAPEVHLKAVHNFER